MILQSMTLLLEDQTMARLSFRMAFGCAAAVVGFIGSEVIVEPDWSDQSIALDLAKLCLLILLATGILSIPLRFVERRRGGRVVAGALSARCRRTRVRAGAGPAVTAVLSPG
jgi:hypothetical protein